MDTATENFDMRSFLRDGTHADHVRLNRHPLLEDMTRVRYSLATYQIVLTAYFHFYRVFETAVERAVADGVSQFLFEPRRKLPWLAKDLSYFGIDPEADAWRPEILQQPMQILDEKQLLGVLYTIEGSSLGGQVISRHLATHLALSPDAGARFFYGYGDQTMPLWQQFQGFINAALNHEESRCSALQAARMTFDTMETVLDEYLVRSQSASRT